MQLPRQRESSTSPSPPPAQAGVLWMENWTKKKYIVANKEQFKILVSYPLLIHHLWPPPKMDVEIQMTKKKEDYKRQYALGGKGIYLWGPDRSTILLLLSVLQIKTPAKCNIEDVSSKLSPVWGNQNLQHAVTAGPPAGEVLEVGRKSNI